MLKNARKYLEEQYLRYFNDLKETQIEYEDLKKIADESTEFLKVSTAYENATSEVAGDSIIALMLSIFFVALLFVMFTPFTINFYIGGLVLLFSVGTYMKKSIKNKLITKKEFNSFIGKMKYFSPEQLQNISKSQDIAVKNVSIQETCLSRLAFLKNKVDALSQILSSDDFVSALEEYYDEVFFEVAEALRKEWETYLEEIKKIDISNVHYTKDFTDELRNQTYQMPEKNKTLNLSSNSLIPAYKSHEE